MPKYDAVGFELPAPVAMVTLRVLGGGAKLENVPLLIDSGADVTLIPSSALAALQIEATDGFDYELMGFDGTKSVAPVVQAERLLLRRLFRGQFLSIDSPVGVLGRNLLKHFAITLGGPKLEWKAV